MIAPGIGLCIWTHKINTANQAEIILTTSFVLSGFRDFVVNNDGILVGEQIAIFPRLGAYAMFFLIFQEGHEGHGIWH
jgi:hypothetical protein